MRNLFNSCLSLSKYLVIVLGVVILLAGCTKQSEKIESTEKPYAQEVRTTSPPSLNPEEIMHTVAKERVNLKYSAPIFKEKVTDLQAPLGMFDYGLLKDSFELVAYDGDWVSVEKSDKEQAWIPVWYSTEAANDIRKESLTRLNLKKNATLSLFPSSELKQEIFSGEQPLYSVHKWKEWFGVSGTSKSWYEVGQIYAPVLLWIHESEVDRLEKVEDDLWEVGAVIPVNIIQDLIEDKLKKGIQQSFVEQLLGSPSNVETSSNLNFTGEPMHLGTIWRYEHESMHLALTFSKAKKLESWTWSPFTDPLKIDYNHGDDALLHSFPVPASAKVNWSWRNKGTLPFTYLEGATDDVVLVRGDDGGYSGMHDDSSIYAIDQQSGKTLWQIDAGFGWAYTKMDEERGRVTVYTPYDPNKKTYRHQVRNVRLSDGKTLWNYRFPTEGNWMMTGAEGVIIFYRKSLEEDGLIITLDMETGRLLWEKPFKEPFRVLNDSEKEPFILIKQPYTVYALNPQTGKLEWEMNANAKEVLADEEAYRNVYEEQRRNPLDPDKSYRWVGIGNQMMLIDLASGNVRASYELRLKEKITIVDDKYLLVQAATDAFDFGDGTTFETSFYDVIREKSIWTIPGRASGAVIEGDRIYLAIDGIPSALNKRTGAVEWQTTIVEHPPAQVSALLAEPLLYWVGGDLLRLNKADGSMNSRFQNVLLGYPDGRGQSISDGLFNREGDSIYLGSANGYFSKFNVKQFKE
ncbi:PQQ-binding-like beta-propeller repeat protein [Paenibacillus sp. L3-i20]|uniref:outer membrane protein assembly factor BamB family protein n=1 Tax=Paenibacillus sp. L3-i20 TaxID=2905833 RepID=UPI001EDE6CB8|nr:PQQ-binding-like beta-propeller repeat protein [Paenibacillus sp. L3-i20]GKU77838.1 hypothetical protein L3i20_v222350 [Paenibacillus sp. L3-i20]